MKKTLLIGEAPGQLERQPGRPMLARGGRGLTAKEAAEPYEEDCECCGGTGHRQKECCNCGKGLTRGDVNDGVGEYDDLCLKCAKEEGFI